MNKSEVLAKGLVDKIGLAGSCIIHNRCDGADVKLVGEIIDHQAGIEYILGVLTSQKHGSIQSLDEIDAVGHRVVHGGEYFKESVILDDRAIEKIERCAQLAPLHNPPNLKGIYAMKDWLPNTPQAAIFDTAFHQTMPDYAYMYAIPYSLYKKYKLRRYGFHGTSHAYVSEKACEYLNLDITKQKIITCHLGNGASITAIQNGKSIDTSMGLTPVEGTMMGTRSGDLDLGVLTYIIEKEEINVSAANNIINKRSGLLGLSGISSDMREVEKAAEKGNERAQLALNVYYYRILKYIGSYTASMGGVDIIVFTGGIGENSTKTRDNVCKKLNFLQLEFDEKKNNNVSGEMALLTTPKSKVKVMVVPTNEEQVIAEETQKLLRA